MQSRIVAKQETKQDAGKAMIGDRMVEKQSSSQEADQQMVRGSIAAKQVAKQHDGKVVMGEKDLPKQVFRNLRVKVNKRKAGDELDMKENLAVKRSRVPSSKSERDKNILDYFEINISLTSSDSLGEYQAVVSDHVLGGERAVPVQGEGDIWQSRSSAETLYSQYHQLQLQTNIQRGNERYLVWERRVEKIYVVRTQFIFVVVTVTTR